MKKIIMSIILTLSLCITPVFAVFAEPDDTAFENQIVQEESFEDTAAQDAGLSRDDVEEIPTGEDTWDASVLPVTRDLEEYTIPSAAAYAFTNEEERAGIINEAEGYPERYDLRHIDSDNDGIADTSYVTPVKLQNPFQSCWAFAAIASAETSLISSGLADSSIDLSERHLAYFARTPINDPSSSQFGEGYIDKGYSASYKLDTGGVPVLATTALASGTGPVLEGNDPDLIYRGLNGFIDQRFFQGALRNLSYSADDDWSIPDDKRFLQSFSLKESYILPSPAGTDDSEYNYDESATAAIKKQLMAGRAVQIGFLADDASPNDPDTEPQFLSNDWAHYGDRFGYANHAVTIIGWDDTIGSDASGVHFREDLQPPGNGAWLVKNSWGSGEEEFPNAGTRNWGIQVPETDELGNPVKDKNGDPVMVGSGYFWLSYYDQTISCIEALQLESADSELIMDAYDYMPASALLSTEFESVHKMANIFQASENQMLEQIAFQTTHPFTTVNYQIYLQPGFLYNPDYGELVYEGEETFEFGGFHKIPLDNPVPILNGQYYSVVITETVSDNSGSTLYTINVPAADNREFKGIIHSLESKVYDGTLWNDLDGYLAKLFPDDYNVASFDNFSIKAYSRPMDVNFSMSINGSANLTYNFKESSLLSIRVTIKGNAPKDLKVKWRCDNEALVDLIPQDDGFRARIRIPLQDEYPGGKCWIHADVYDGETKIGSIPKPVNIKRPYINKVSLPDFPRTSTTNVCVYTGNAIEPRLIVQDSDSNTLVPERDFITEFKDNTKCGAATVHVIPAGATDPKNNAYRYFAIRPAAAKITEITAGALQMTVRVEDQSESGITGYLVQYRESGVSGWNTKTYDAGSTELVINDLAPGKEYEVRACAYVEIPDYTKYNYMIEESYDGDFSDVTLSGIIQKKSLSQAVISGAKKTVCTGKPIKPAVTVKLGSAELESGTDYTVSFKNNTKVGTATVTVTGKGNYSGTVKTTFKIVPKATKLTSLTAGKGSVTAKWKKQSVQTSGYQIRYSTNKDFKSAKTAVVKSPSTLSKTIKNLTRNKTYYVSVRTYKTVSGKKYYSAWSKAKSIKTK